MSVPLCHSLQTPLRECWRTAGPEARPVQPVPYPEQWELYILATQKLFLTFGTYNFWDSQSRDQCHIDIPLSCDNKNSLEYSWNIMVILLMFIRKHHILVPECWPGRNQGQRNTRGTSNRKSTGRSMGACAQVSEPPSAQPFQNGSERGNTKMSLPGSKPTWVETGFCNMRGCLTKNMDLLISYGNSWTSEYSFST